MAATVKVTSVPTATVWLWGWVVITGADGSVSSRVEGDDQIVKREAVVEAGVIDIQPSKEQFLAGRNIDTGQGHGRRTFAGWSPHCRRAHRQLR